MVQDFGYVPMNGGGKEYRRREKQRKSWLREQEMKRYIDKRVDAAVATSSARQHEMKRDRG